MDLRVVLSSCQDFQWSVPLSTVHSILEVQHNWLQVPDEQEHAGFVNKNEGVWLCTGNKEFRTPPQTEQVECVLSEWQLRACRNASSIYPAALLGKHQAQEQIHKWGIPRLCTHSISSLQGCVVADQTNQVSMGSHQQLVFHELSKSLPAVQTNPQWLYYLVPHIRESHTRDSRRDRWD